MGATLNLTPTYGRSVKGTRACGEKPTSPGTRLSTLGALTVNAILTARCFEGTLNGQVFLFFLEHFLCPVLQPGQIVILDNAKAHGVEEVRELIESKGARLLYLPPYSPDLNPIELAWSKVKHYLRKTRARTVDALYQALSQALTTLPMSHSPEPANPLGSLGELRYRDDFYSGRSPMSTKKTQAKSGACLDKRYVAWAIGCMHSGNGFETTSRRTPGMAAAMPTTT
jgi:transposase